MNPDVDTYIKIIIKFYRYARWVVHWNKQRSILHKALKNASENQSYFVKQHNKVPWAHNIDKSL